MPLFILNDADGLGSDDLDPLQAFVDLVIIADDTGIGIDPVVNGMQQVTYNATTAGIPQQRLDDLVNQVFTPDYGAGPQQVDTVVIAGLSDFVLDDGTSLANNGTALPPTGSGQPGDSLNPTDFCLVIYDTQQNICVARNGTGGDIDLTISNPVLLYHEFSHAFRIVTNSLLALGAGCNPSSPEENAAITEENDMRTQIANRQGETPELRDPNIHCGSVGCSSSGCCIIATLASKSLSSQEVNQLRAVRDHFVRSTETGHEFFEHFFHDYYAFSPQVCTLLASDSRLGAHLLEGYINPLLEFWKLMINRSQQRPGPDELGRAFMDAHPDQDANAVRLAALERTREFWEQDGDMPADLQSQLVTLLHDRARPSEYVQWSLVAPVEIYYELLAMHLRGADSKEIGAGFSQALTEWAPELPIGDIWARLPASGVRRELKFCERMLLQSETCGERFRQRLVSRFPEVSAIQWVANCRGDAAGATS